MLFFTRGMTLPTGASLPKYSDGQKVRLSQGCLDWNADEGAPVPQGFRKGVIVGAPFWDPDVDTFDGSTKGVGDWLYEIRVEAGENIVMYETTLDPDT